MMQVLRNENISLYFYILAKKVSLFISMFILRQMNQYRQTRPRNNSSLGTSAPIKCQDEVSTNNIMVRSLPRPRDESASISEYGDESATIWGRVCHQY